jgi:hypothetical protein
LLNDEKFCTSCKKTLPLVLFQKSRRGAGSRHSQCKICKNTASAELRKRYATRESVTIPLEKYCASCKEIKPSALFHKATTTADGVSPRCKACNKQYQDSWAKKNRAKAILGSIRYEAKRRGHAIARISEAELDRLFALHPGICDMPWCKNPAKHLDHCHTSGVVRGLLCTKCNLALGLFEDNPAKLRGAIEYLAQKTQTV